MASSECDGIFGTCLSTAAMAGVLNAIIVAGAFVMFIPFMICTIQQRKKQIQRQEALEGVQLQLRATQAATVADMARDDVAGNVDPEGRPWRQVWVRDFGEAVDEILPATPVQAHVSPLRRNPVDLEQGG